MWFPPLVNSEATGIFYLRMTTVYWADHMCRSTLSQRQVLRRSTLFTRLGDGETDAILAYAQVAKYAAGDQIVVKGDPGDSMMAVLNGRVSISAPSPDGRQVVLSMLHDGDIFGEIALLDGKERTANVNALTDCEILIVPRRSFWPMLERRSDICIDLILVLCERLRHTNQQVEDLAFLDLEPRMAKVLLRLAEESGAGESGQASCSQDIATRTRRTRRRVARKRQQAPAHMEAVGDRVCRERDDCDPRHGSPRRARLIGWIRPA